LQGADHGWVTWDSECMARLAVVGAGVAGLAAAHRLRTLGHEVVVLEASGRIGGKLLTTGFAGMAYDEGAESLATRDPAVPSLLAELGLADQLVDPATTSAGLVVRGAIKPLPVGTVLGIPSSARSLAPTLGWPAVVRASLDRVLPHLLTEDDWSVGRLVRRRLGAAVADRIVDPLLGGVYAGRADDLSLAATVPALARTVVGSPSLLHAAASARLPGGGGPRLQALAGGMGLLPQALATGLDIRLSTTVRELHASGDGWRLVTGPVPDPTEWSVDGVVLAVPAPGAARLLAGSRPALAELLRPVDYASMAIVSLAFERSAVVAGGRSGLLVPAAEGLPVKAITFSTTKWAHVADGASGAFLLRCSIGRYGEAGTLQRSDEQLVEDSLRSLAALIGLRAQPLEARVTRWGGGLPQYAVGHVKRVDALQAQLRGEPGLALCGAAYAGVGIAACLTGGRAAADDLVAGLAARAV
jgi:oxygen-dependent protoporphyrinogen oxidase